jgi:hypothetical protein
MREVNRISADLFLDPDYVERAFVVDVGSGNTKISWLAPSGIKTLEAAGSKYFQKGITDEAVFADVQAKANQIPQNQRSFILRLGA